MSYFLLVTVIHCASVKVFSDLCQFDTSEVSEENTRNSVEISIFGFLKALPDKTSNSVVS